MADDHRPATAARALYDEDFFLWTQAQAKALRAKGAGSEVDWETVAEEIEDMGKSDLRECYSRVETIIEHLFKLASSQRSEPRAGWEETIARERASLELTLTASLRRQVEASLATRHQRAVKFADREFARHEPGVVPDTEQHWSLPQILGEQDDPIA